MTDKPGAKENQMWGGRFAEGPAAIMEEINASIDIDRRLWREDIEGSKAHSTMLAAVGIISGGRPGCNSRRSRPDCRRDRERRFCLFQVP